eukprot:scaffold2062_cov273-Chaetoceros_neogracile.AAC.27
MGNTSCVEEPPQAGDSKNKNAVLNESTEEQSDKNGCGVLAEVTEAETTNSGAITNDPEQQQTPSWLQPAIDLWVKRALMSIQRVNKDKKEGAHQELTILNFEHRLCHEAKQSMKLRPNDYPPAKTYIRATIKGIRNDPRLQWKGGPNGIEYFKPNEFVVAGSNAMGNTPCVEQQPSQGDSKNKNADESTEQQSQDKNGCDALEEVNDGENTTSGANTINDLEQQDISWLQPAIDLWVKRALTSIQRVNKDKKEGTQLPILNFDFRLCQEAKKSMKLRPNDCPPAKTYIRATIKGIRNDPRLQWKKGPNGIEYFKSSENDASTAVLGVLDQRRITVSVTDSAPNLLGLTKERITALVSHNSPLDASKLKVLYKDTYGSCLDHNQLGFSKLRQLLKTIPSIESKNMPSALMLILVVTPEMSTSVISNGTNKDNRLVTCDSTTNRNEAVVLDEPRPTTTRAAVQKQYPLFQSVHELAIEDSHQLHAIEENAKTAASTLTSQPEDKGIKTASQRLCIGNQSSASSFEEMALLGHLSSGDPIFLNTHEPFCLATIGVQGAGKSHTLACVLENCLLACKSDHIIRLKRPMTTLVLHYDQNSASVCEAAGLLSASKHSGLCVTRSKAIVLVSPTFYKQRKAFYGEHCAVAPLLFRWSSLTADHIKRIMRIGAGDNQLYVASFMTLLRGYQRQAVVPDFKHFINEVREMCSLKGQQGPLEQRIVLLESMVAESEVNADIMDESMDLEHALSSGLELIFADLTDPLLSKEEANGIFQVVVEQFRSIPVPSGKVLALDEAHKFMDGIKSDGLSEAIVDVARLMRHDGMRLVVSTQSPKALAPELLELVSVAVLHHFHSQDWWSYLQQKLPLSNDAWESIISLAPGNALVFASRSTSRVTHLTIRPRLTADLGASRTYN